MSLEIRFTPEAEDTFASVAVQLQAKWGEKFVIALQEKISKVNDIISDDPYIYPATGTNINVRKCVLHKNCSMIYRVNDTHIDIICFWDNRQEPMVF
jgi:plasmid stabilization system protein ParE